MDDKASSVGLPRGVADYLVWESDKLAQLEYDMLKTAREWGYSRIMPSPLEFEDVIASGMASVLQSRTFRIDDWQTGRLLAIPSDVTPQIARIVATRMKGAQLPLRISYCERVLRHTEIQSGQHREVMQLGVEYVGVSSPEADAEAIALAVDMLKKSCVGSFKICLNQVSFCQGILEASNLNGRDLETIKEAVGCKDLIALDRSLQGLTVNRRSCKELLLLPRLFGGEEVIEVARSSVTNQKSIAALDNLQQVIDILKVYDIDDCLTIDLGETRSLGYHTGISYEGFIPGLGEPVLSGGRYDTLIGRYGYDVPATGFTLNLVGMLNNITECNNKLLYGVDVLILGVVDSISESIRVSRFLRERGYNVIFNIKSDFSISDDIEKSSNVSCILCLDSCSNVIKLSGHGLETYITKDQLNEYFPLK